MSDTFLPYFEELNEARLTYKRKYTDNHPARRMNSVSKVRTNVLEKIADGVITEEDFVKYLEELGAHKSWRKRNSNLFKVTEKGIILSKKGRRMFNALKNSKPINDEAPETTDMKVRSVLHENSSMKNFLPLFEEFMNEAYMIGDVKLWIKEKGYSQSQAKKEFINNPHEVIDYIGRRTIYSDSNDIDIVDALNKHFNTNIKLKFNKEGFITESAEKEN